MEEIAHLIIKVSSDQVGKAEKDLDRLGYTATRTQKATDGFTSGWGKLKSALVATGIITTARAGLRKLLDTAKQFESLEAQLKTATGSADKAAFAFSAIQDFARETPYDLAQATEAFISLVNRGLTPSERALRSYGDTASAMGLQLSDMVLAVSNATHHEFEVLKRFGVSARQESDGISFSFRGASTKVKDDAKSIEDYFIKLGEKNFAGAMVERMNTIEGKLSNLGDAWDFLFATISKAGAGDLIKRALDIGIDALTELTTMIASGELVARVDAITGKFSTMFDAIKEGADLAKAALDKAFGPDLEADLKETSKSVGREFLDAMKNIPENLTAVVKGFGASMGAISIIVESANDFVRDSFKATFDLIVTLAVNTGKAIGEGLNPFADRTKILSDLFEKQKSAIAGYGTTVAANFGIAKESIKGAIDTWQDEISAIEGNREASLKATDDKIAAAKRLSEEYEAGIKIQAAWDKFMTGGDRLEQFGKGASGHDPSEAEREKFDALKKYLNLEEVSIAESYQKRYKLIVDNTEKDAATRDVLLKELNAKTSLEYAKADQERLDNVKALQEKLLEAELHGREGQAAAIQTQLDGEKAAMVAAYEFHRKAIVADTTLTEKQRADKLAYLKADSQEELAILRQANADKMVEYAKAGADHFTTIEGLQKQLFDAQASGRLIEADALQMQLEAERVALVANNEFRKKLILDDATLTAEEKARRVIEIDKKLAAQQRALDLETAKARLNIAADFFGNIATIAKVFGEKGAKIAKAAAIVQATVKTYESAVSAYASMAGIPYIGPALGAAAAAAAIAAGVANIQQIRSANYSGAYEHGGQIPAGKYGLVGETGQPEYVRGPAQVTSARTTRDLRGGMQPTNQAAPQNVYVEVHNNSDSTATVRESNTADGKLIEILINKVESRLAGRIPTGGNPFTKNLESTYPQLRRGAA